MEEIKEENIQETKESLQEDKEENIQKDKLQEYIERLQRLQAEFENFQKRTDKEKKENSSNANANLISQLIKVLDNFELSLKHNKDEGIKLIYDELMEILEKQGLTIIDTSGKFNPKIHEVLMQEDGEEEGKILEVLQKGYMLNNKLLRASKVKIGKLITENE